jgi:outer membrane protein TolC
MRERSGISMLGSVWMLVCFLAPDAAQGQAAGGAQGLSLEQALRSAEAASEEVAIARAGVMRSEGEHQRARSEYFPQVFGSVSFTRTLASEFSSLGGGGADSTSTDPVPSDCGTFTPDVSLPLSSRVDSLEAAVRCQSRANPFGSFDDLPFGRENIWRFDVSVSQTLFSGGRVQAQSAVASASRRQAEMALASARAELLLTVTEAYYDAALADRLLRISEATLQQADTTLAQVRLARDVGEESEFELLRAQVTRDTQEPLVIQRRADFELAMLRLKQLLNLPADDEITLTTELSDTDLTVVQLAGEILEVEFDSTLIRVPVRQAEEGVRINEGLVRVARSQRLPSLSLAFSYGRVGYPTNGSPFDVSYRTNSTVSATVQLPIFTGFRIAGEEKIARADLDEARARLDMTRELAALDNRDAFARYTAARATWEASAGTVEQAEQAYRIAEVRYREGISTQLELNDSRILQQQAQANRAQAARNLQIAQLRLALLPYLPISGGLQGSAAATSPMQLQPQQIVPPAQQTGTQTTTTRAASSTGGQR